MLVTLVVSSLGFYLVIASNLFRNDKMAYIFDSNAELSRNLSIQVQSQIAGATSKIDNYLQLLDPARTRFTPEAQSRIESDLTFNRIILIRPGSQGGYSKVADAKKKSIEDEPLKDVLTHNFVKSTDLNGASILKTNSDSYWIGVRIGDESTDQRLIAAVHMVSESAFNDISLVGAYGRFLVDENGVVLASNGYASLNNFADWSFFQEIRQKNLPGGTYRDVNMMGEPVLVSYSSSGAGKISIVTLIKESEALKAIEELIQKSLLVFLALVSASVIVSVVASGQLTRKLRALADAAKEVGQGNFDVRVGIESNDEVGRLAEGFNAMAGEIERLIDETQNKARMEKELETAKTVQETLFPDARMENQSVSVDGFYEPASECGGDWWHYSQVGDKIYFWIGDATGHGAPAALITSAAKSAATIIERLPGVTPKIVVELLNAAIYETSKGRILMTFFFGCLDLQTGNLSYVNASHDPPYLLAGDIEKIKKRDLVTLNDLIGKRLGEGPDTLYEEVSLDLKPNDLVICYTDGIPDIKSPEGEAWGERSFLKALMDAANENRSSQSVAIALQDRMASYRQKSPLDDDVTCFLFQYKGAA